jgi:anti-sigma factor RsiW
VKSNDDIPDDAWIDERIEAFLDGDLPADDRAVFERAVAHDVRWHRHLDLAGHVRHELRRWPKPQASRSLTRAILRRSRRMEWSERVAHLLAPFAPHWRRAWQPVAAVATVVLLAVVAITSLRPARPPEPASVEVDRALSEVKWTLGYISRTGQQAGASLQRALDPARPETPPE